jgi:anti-sigma factor RsiW
MSSLCDTIDTLAMVYLDDELDAAERRELELHLHDCGPCREHIAAERMSRVKLRAMLAPPPAPELLRARIGTALDREDRTTALAGRAGRLRRWVLPGAAVTAAAAALVLFVVAPQRTAPAGGEVARAAVKVQSRSRPLEVQGASTGPWLAQHFEADVMVPEFDTSVRVVGARLVQVTGYEAAQIFYEVVAGPTRLELSAFVLKDVRAGALRGTRKVLVDGNTLWLTELDSTAVVSYEDRTGRGYVFMSQSFSTKALLDVVLNSDLIRRSRERVDP